MGRLARGVICQALQCFIHSLSSFSKSCSYLMKKSLCTSLLHIIADLNNVNYDEAKITITLVSLLCNYNKYESRNAVLTHLTTTKDAAPLEVNYLVYFGTAKSCLSAQKSNYSSENGHCHRSRVLGHASRLS